ncbi:MAG: hypothetical protein SFV19_18080 [Rhodospirillaceae bacterium]|nr:hypothetical protein [Rhodospirillaceae bacterium]
MTTELFLGPSAWTMDWSFPHSLRSTLRKTRAQNFCAGAKNWHPFARNGCLFHLLFQGGFQNNRRTFPAPVPQIEKLFSSWIVVITGDFVTRRTALPKGHLAAAETHRGPGGECATPWSWENYIMDGAPTKSR